MLDSNKWMYADAVIGLILTTLPFFTVATE